MIIYLGIRLQGRIILIKSVRYIGSLNFIGILGSGFYQKHAASHIHSMTKALTSPDVRKFFFSERNNMKHPDKVQISTDFSPFPDRYAYCLITYQGFRCFHADQASRHQNLTTYLTQFLNRVS